MRYASKVLVVLRFVLTVSSILCLCGPAFSEPYEDALAAYNRRDYATAAKLLPPLAAKGDARAQNTLGFMYQNGQGMPEDPSQAVVWYRKAAEQGNALGQVNLGGMYASGRGVPKDYVQAVTWYRKAAQQNNALGQANLAVMYEHGRGVPKDYAQALAWYRKAAEKGSVIGMIGLGYVYDMGLGVAQDYQQALAWYRKAAEQGDPLAQSNLGEMYRYGKGVAQDYQQALVWYHKAAEQGDPNGQANLGELYQNGLGVPQDYQQALTWFRKAAEHDGRDGQVRLGDMYRNGAGVARDYQEALKWYRKAAEQDSPQALAALGEVYRNGLAVQQDHQQALAWYRKSVEYNDPRGQADLGDMYRDGLGVRQNYQEAVAWYRKSAKQGYPAGQASLGEMYRDGLGVAKEWEEAKKWYTLAARGGNEDAKLRLGGLEAPSQTATAATPKPTPQRGQELVQEAKPAFRMPTYHALIIANKNYRKLPKLETPLDDAREVEKVLRVKYGFKDITVLKDATRAEVNSALILLRTNLTTDDSLLIYYAGHGHIDSETERGYWQPVDADRNDETNWISTDDVTNYLKGMHARHVLVVSDSCYSGTLTRAAGSPKTKVGGEMEWINRMMERRARTALTSGGLEPVKDQGGEGHSVFAQAFLEVLRENDQPREMDDLFQKIKRRVVLNAKQTPEYGDIRFADHKGGDFVFVPAGPASPVQPSQSTRQ